MEIRCNVIVLCNSFLISVYIQYKIYYITFYVVFHIETSREELIMKFPKTVKDFLSLTFKQQIHTCALMYLSANGIAPFHKGKIDPRYFGTKAYLSKLPTQIIKNIVIMFIESPRPCELKNLPDMAKEYTTKKQSDAARKTAKEITSKKEYELDIMSFLREG